MIYFYKENGKTTKHVIRPEFASLHGTHNSANLDLPKGTAYYVMTEEDYAALGSPTLELLDLEGKPDGIAEGQEAWIEYTKTVPHLYPPNKNGSDLGSPEAMEALSKMGLGAEVDLDGLLAGAFSQGMKPVADTPHPLNEKPVENPKNLFQLQEEERVRNEELRKKLDEESAIYRAKQEEENKIKEAQDLTDKTKRSREMPSNLKVVKEAPIANSSK